MLACRLASKLLAGPPHHHQGRDPLRRPRRLAAANRLQVEGTEMDRMDSDKLRPSTGAVMDDDDHDSVEDYHLALFESSEPKDPVVTTLI